MIGGSAKPFWTVVAAVGVSAGLILAFVSDTSRGRMIFLQCIWGLCLAVIVVRASGGGDARASRAAFGRTHRQAIWLALAITLLLWCGAAGAGFVGDDFSVLREARTPPADLLLEHLTMQQERPVFRPLSWASYSIDFRLWGASPAGFHLTNLLLHLITMAGVFRLAVLIGLGVGTATWTALFFGVLPIHAEPIVWITGRQTLLATALTVWSVSAYARYRVEGRRQSHLLAIGLGLAALLSKETAFVLPLLAGLVELVTGHPPRLRPLVPIGALALGVFSFRTLALGGLGDYPSAGGAALLTIEPKILEGLLVRAPAHMLFGINGHYAGIAAVALLAGAISGLLVALTLYSRPTRFERSRLAFAFGWMVACCLPVHMYLYIDPGLSNSRVLYLASLGAAMGIALLVRSQAASRTGPVIALACLYSLASVHNLAAWQQSGHLVETLLTTLRTEEPVPPRGTEYVFEGVPDRLGGTYFLNDGIDEAVRLAYGRPDLTARHSRTPTPRPSGRPQIRWNWTGQPGRVIERVGSSPGPSAH